jgi:hypothetical protein
LYGSFLGFSNKGVRMNDNQYYSDGYGDGEEFELETLPFYDDGMEADEDDGGIAGSDGTDDLSGGDDTVDETAETAEDSDPLYSGGDGGFGESYSSGETGAFQEVVVLTDTALIERVDALTDTVNALMLLVLLGFILKYTLTLFARG